MTLPNFLGRVDLMQFFLSRAKNFLRTPALEPFLFLDQLQITSVRKKLRLKKCEDYTPPSFKNFSLRH